MGTQYIYALTSSWNGAGGGYRRAIQLNVENAEQASADSDLLDLQVGGTTRFAVSRDGNIILGSQTTNKVKSGELNNFLQGTGNISSGSYNMLTAFYNRSDANFSRVDGASNKVYAGAGSYVVGFVHAEGRANVASASYSHLEGELNTTTQNAYGSHVEGRSNIAYASSSHAEGFNTSTRGIYSHAEGEYTTAFGRSSHAEGYYTISSGSYQTVVGQYNTKGNVKSLFVVGGGTSTTRKDVLSVTSSLVAVSASIASDSLGTGTVYSNKGTLTNINPSDQTLKKDVNPVTYGINEILQLNPVTYYWLDDVVTTEFDTRKKFGFIAQEVQPYLPELVLQLENGKYGLDTNAFIPILVKAIQELKAEVADLKSKLP